jgi:HK97 family phage major capsid protein
LNYTLVKYDSRPTKFEYFDDTANDIVLASEGNTFVNTGNDPVFGSVTPTALDLFKTLGVKASYELIDDSAFNVAEFLKRVALKRYFRGISRLLITGHDASGNAAPNVTSLLSLLQSNPNVVTTSVFANGIEYDNLVALIESLDQDYAENAVFILNQSTLNNLRGQLDGFGRPLYTPTPTANSASFGTLLGLPVIVEPTMPSIAESAYPVILADLSPTLGVQVNEETPSIRVFKETHVETLESLFSVTSRIASVALLPNKALTALKIAAA